jgi:cyanobactin maturation PatA/PatG family protease
MVPPGACFPDRHGTQICSLIFGNGDPVDGIAKDCSGLVLPIFFGSRGGERPRPASQLDLARAIEFALEQNVSIINVSAGQKVAAAEADTHLEQALKRCADRRVLLVAAAGNDGCECLHLPAGSPLALAVGAYGPNRQPLDVSNWGKPYQLNGLLAPGGNLTVADLDNGVTKASGTSYATAVVSGVAAALLSVAMREAYPIDPVDVGEILLQSAIPCDQSKDGACERFLKGRLDVSAVLSKMRRLGLDRLREKRLQSVRLEELYCTGEVRQRGENMDVQNSTSSVAQSTVVPAALEQAGCGCQKSADIEDQDNKVLKRQGQTDSVVQATVPSGQAVTQQGCSCGGGQPPQLVYALGSLWFDFGTEARHDLFVQAMPGGAQQANNPAELIAFLRQPGRRQFATGLTFILMQEHIPLYAVQPAGPFALDTYEAILDAVNSSMGPAAASNEFRFPDSSMARRD